MDEKGFRLLTGKLKDFSLSETLECGQYFRYKKIDDNPYQYEITAKERALKIGLKQDKLYYNASSEEFEKFWVNFFDLKRDYESIKQTLAGNDFVIRDALMFAPGIRLLSQDPWECLLCFIISQNNRIPMIMQAVKNISERFGERISGSESFSIPSAEKVASLTEQELKDCKTGFRAKYILDGARRVASGRTVIYGTKSLETEALRERLMEIKGVGPKIADCVMLFSMGRYEVFPTDVWIIKVMEKLYFGGNKTALKDIHALADKKFGEYAGFAQQYLYHYARINKI